MNTYPELYSLSLNRFSCRSYSSQPVPEDAMMAVLDVARLAPSACNRQPWIFVIADTPDEREAVAQSYARDWIRTAPECIIACGVHDQAWHRPHDGKDHTDVDLSIAIEHLCLAAASLHLGTCWVCNFDPEIIRSAFRLPEGVEPVAIIPIGFPAEGVSAPDKTRKELSEIVRRGKF